MKKYFKALTILMILVLMIVGCGKNEKFAPVSINAGVDVCEICSMLVTDDEHATQLILDSGRALKFDDIGDLFVWTERNGLDDVNVQYVRDYHTMEWIELDTAYFAYDSSFKTPMGYGVLSFKEQKDAEAYIAEHGIGQLMTAGDLATHTWESSMDHHDHDHGEHDHHGEHDDHDDHGHEHEEQAHDH